MHPFSDRRTMLKGGVLLASVFALAVVTLTSILHYEHERTTRWNSLSESIELHAELIESMVETARRSTSTEDVREPELRASVIELLRRAHRDYEGFGETGEFVLGSRSGDSIVFHFEPRHDGLPENRAVPWDSATAAPMRLALRGGAGTTTALDYRDEPVLAAYRPIEGLGLGLVAKLDIAEIRDGSLRLGVLAGVLTLGVIGLIAVVLLRLTLPLLEQVEKDERRLRAILDNAGEAILGLDERGRIVSSNAAACTMFSVETEAFEGADIAGFLPLPEERPELDWIRDGSYEGHGIREDGDRFPVAVRTTAVHRPGTPGVRPLGVAVIRDLTHQREAEREISDQAAALEEERARAESANLAKSQFLANMSHEIRTPMTAILGFTENLLDLGPSEREVAVRTIQRNGQHLLALINDILDLSKIESGKLLPELRRFSPYDLLAEVQSLMNVRARAKGIELVIDCPEPLPETIESDSTRLRQILINLVGNAIKFTEIGEVRVEPTCPPRSDGGERQVCFDVIDTGCGMTAAQLENLFQPFVQADGSTTRLYGGTGLGLTISRRFAQMLGGDVEVVESRPGRGTRFRVRVETGSLEGVRLVDRPAGVGVLPRRASRREKVDLSRLRILLVEDGPDNRALISHILKRAGATVTMRENGREGADEALRQAELEQPYDLVLMDIQMPVLDGVDATKLLRRRGYTGLVIALTAHAMEGDRTKYMRAGFDDYATKPIDRDQLLSLIAARVASDRAGIGASESASVEGV